MTTVKGIRVGYLEKLILELEHEIVALETEFSRLSREAPRAAHALAKVLCARAQFRADVLAWATTTAQARLQMLVQGPRLAADMAEWQEAISDAERWVRAYETAAAHARAALGGHPTWVRP